MRRPIAISLALMLVAVSVSPVFAARIGSSGGKRGSISVTISNTKGDSDTCTVKATGKYLADSQTVYLGSGQLGSGPANAIYVTNSEGGLTAYDLTVSRADFNNQQIVVVIKDSWFPVLDLDGNNAVWSIANNCQPAV